MLRNCITSLFCCFFALSIVLSVAGQSEGDLPRNLGKALGIFKINKDVGRVAGFEDFAFFRLEKRPGEDVDNPALGRNGTVEVNGFVTTNDGTMYEFVHATIVRRSSGEFEKIEFRTATVNGISFRFTGRFLEEKIFEGGQYSYITGTLTKYENGNKRMSHRLPFYPFAEL